MTGNANPDRSAFGAWLHATLRARNLNRQDLARRMGVDPSVVSRWTLNRTPGPEACRQIAAALALPDAEVLLRAGHIAGAAGLDMANPTRARLHALVDQLDVALLEPHLAILERTLALVNLPGDDG